MKSGLKKIIESFPGIKLKTKFIQPLEKHPKDIFIQFFMHTPKKSLSIFINFI
jgi:muconolactone delta-isomerase